MTATLDGKSIIVSLYDPNPAEFGRTVQYSIADGSTEQVWHSIGSPQATCPQFIVWKGRVWIVVTTAVEHMPAERRIDSPTAGGLFLGETDFEVNENAFGRLTQPFVEPK
jgi:hypothetical protein